MNTRNYSLVNNVRSDDSRELWLKLPVTETELTRAKLIAKIECVIDRFTELHNADGLLSSIASKQQNPRQNRLNLLIIVLDTARKLLTTNTTMNRRTLYYKLKNGKTMHLAKAQAAVDKAVNNVAKLLQCSPWKLHLIPACSSLVAGDIKFFLADETSIDCSTSVTLIPHVALNVKSIRVRAKFVLVVEKDTVFQELVKRNCTGLLNCILITGKGYPDMNARMLVRKLCEEMFLPTYIFVDCDPFGVDIMLVYRYGSLTLAAQNESLASPNARWLGALPSEVTILGAGTIPLAQADSAKLETITTKTLSFIETNALKLRSLQIQLTFKFIIKEKILRELTVMKKNGKAEIESVMSCLHPQYFATTYLKCKIKGEDCI